MIELKKSAERRGAIEDRKHESHASFSGDQAPKTMAILFLVAVLGLQLVQTTIQLPECDDELDGW